MIRLYGFSLRIIQRKHYPFILSWYKSNSTVSGFVNPWFYQYDLKGIQDLYDRPSTNNFPFIIETSQGIPLGAIIIKVEWENRNAIIDIMMGPGQGQNFGIGFKVLSGIFCYCKEELNLRRLEIKISEKNKVMMKAFKFFPKDESLIIDIFNGKGEWDEKIKKYFAIDQTEYEKNWEKYVTEYIREVVFSMPVSELMLKDDAYYNGQFISFHVNSILFSKRFDELKNLLLLASGDFKKSDIYHRIPPRFLQKEIQNE